MSPRLHVDRLLAPVAVAGPTPMTPGRGRWFAPLFLVVLGLLVVSLVTAFLPSGPWSWLAGALYIAYDTWLLVGNTIAARREVRREDPLPDGPPATVAVLIAARNERPVLPRTLAAVLAERPHQVILIDDGSTDGTAGWLKSEWQVELADGYGLSHRDPSLLVLSRAGGGKSRALNAALPHVTAQVVLTLDADTIVAPGSLTTIARAFADPTLDVAGGILEPRCEARAGFTGWIARAFEFHQAREYQRSFCWRRAWSRSGELVLMSGAFAAFQAERLCRVGGFDPASQVEDYDVLYRLNRQAMGEGRRIRTAILPNALAITDAPGQVRQFMRQRQRWFGGFIQTIFRHRDLVGDPRLGALGRHHLLIKTVDTVVPVYALAALATLLAQLVMGRGLAPWIAVLIIGKFAIDLVCHAACIGPYHRWLGRPVGWRDRALGILATFLEPFAFQLLRQAAAASGWIRFLRGRITWESQRARRAGHAALASAPPIPHSPPVIAPTRQGTP